MNGFINVIKPPNMSSAKVVQKLKRRVYPNRFGHLGTLDPLAGGVLPIAVGKATRLFDFMLKKVKVYVAEFTFGVETDTLDLGGKVVAESPVNFSLAELDRVAAEMVGKQLQLPPKYSAKSVGGQRAYDLARKGVEFELAPKEIEIYSMARTKVVGENIYEFEIACSGGTYIRSIVRDLAARLGAVGLMSKLTRTKCGIFELSSGLTLEEIESMEDIGEALMPVQDALANIARYNVPEELYEKLANGVKIQMSGLPNDDFSVWCRDELFGLGTKDEQGRLVVSVNLRDTD